MACACSVVVCTVSLTEIHGSTTRDDGDAVVWGLLCCYDCAHALNHRVRVSWIIRACKRRPSLLSEASRLL